MVLINQSINQSVKSARYGTCQLFYLQPTRVQPLGSRVVSVLDSGAEGPGFKSQPRHCRVTVLGKLFTPVAPLFTKQQKLVAALLRVARVTAGLAESNGSLPPGLWLTLPACWLPRTGISSGTLRSAIEYGLPLRFLYVYPEHGTHTKYTAAITPKVSSDLTVNWISSFLSANI